MELCRETEAEGRAGLRENRGTMPSSVFEVLGQVQLLINASVY